MDHFRKAEELLTQVAEARDALKGLHAEPLRTVPGREQLRDATEHRRAAIAAGYDEIRHLTATAKIHATLAVAQASYDAATLREVVGSRHRLDDSRKGADE